MTRTYIKDLASQAGQKVLLKGWVVNRRDLGKIVFLDLKDFSGQTQVVVVPQKEAAYAGAQKVRDWWVVAIEGTAQKRPANMIKPGVTGGDMELAAESLTIINEAKALPFPVNTDGYDISEELRLKYRYLDLRRERLLKNLWFRQEYMKRCREYLMKRYFLEVETPILSKSTPEGSRDFVVPSRLQPGKFYALPQSPQQYKQMLMLSGFERYFQFARVFRDEDLRANRLFEHTQLDLEMAFVDMEDVMSLVEGMVTEIVEGFGFKIQDKPFLRLDHDEIVAQYDSDKPDLRKDKNDPKLMSFAWVVNWPMFEKNDDGSLVASHHPFTAVKDEHVAWLGDPSKIFKVRSKQYDLTLNGQEIFGGSIRTHQPELLVKIFETLGHTPKDIKSQFGHMLEAFDYGIPPHGGIGGGVERFLMSLLNEKNIREVVPLPTSTSGLTAIMDSPSAISKDQLNELHLSVRAPKKASAKRTPPRK